MGYARGDGAIDAEEYESAREAIQQAQEALATASSGNMTRNIMRTLKETAQAAPKGATVECPTCNTMFTKNHPRQAFCNKDGQHRCKTRYHNTATEQRRERSLRFMR